MRTNIKAQELPLVTSRYSLVRGFTLIELILVIAISLILGVIGTSNYLGLRDKKSLDSNTQRIIEDVRSASANSLVVVDDKEWGIRFRNEDSDYYEIWQKAADGTETIAKKFILSSNISFIDPSEGQCKDFKFIKGQGLPELLSPPGTSCTSSTLTITLTNGGESKSLTINPNGRIDY